MWIREVVARKEDVSLAILDVLVGLGESAGSVNSLVGYARWMGAILSEVDCREIPWSDIAVLSGNKTPR